MITKLKVTDANATLTVTNLPKGLTYDTRRQLVQGKIALEGTYHYTLTATTETDTIVEKITLVITSDMISPTPAMSWIS